MNKIRPFFKTIKIILLYLFYGLKITLTLFVRLFKKVSRDISKRLRFSITLKTASIYTLTFSKILLLSSFILISSFGFFLLYQSKYSLEKSARVSIDILKDSTGMYGSKLKRYADIEGINVTLFNKQRGISYTTQANKNNITFSDDTNRPLGMFFTSDKYMHLNVQTGLGDNIYYIQVSRFMMKEMSYLGMLLSALVISFLAAVMITVIVGSRTIRKMLKPIDDMISTARSISARALHTRLDVVDSHDELKELAETFNEMLDRIQISYEQQNQFVSDASHELRTPISVIQGYANLLQRWGKEDKAVLDEAVSAIKNEAESMKDLVENLLFLARTDKKTQKLEKHPFSMNELIDEVLKETKLIDSEHNITSDVNEAITIDADKGLIKQALRIFIDNSLKYTGAHGTIKINSLLKDNKAIVSIQDNGIGISKEDLPYIFNRFYKCDKSRTRDGKSTGLGLCIAKWIVEKHGGAINVQSVLDEGTKISVTLPVKR